VCVALCVAGSHRGEVEAREESGHGDEDLAVEAHQPWESEEQLENVLPEEEEVCGRG